MWTRNAYRLVVPPFAVRRLLDYLPRSSPSVWLLRSAELR
jgi:hypothetical protein